VGGSSAAATDERGYAKNEGNKDDLRVLPTTPRLPQSSKASHRSSCSRRRGASPPVVGTDPSMTHGPLHRNARAFRNASARVRYSINKSSLWARSKRLAHAGGHVAQVCLVRTRSSTIDGELAVDRLGAARCIAVRALNVTAAARA